MTIVRSHVCLLAITPNPEALIEEAARTCYKSEHKICDGEAVPFIKRPIHNGHESTLEHASATFRIVCDRGVSHELVRHRLASYSQESTRYCDCGKKGVQFVVPDKLADNPHLHNALIAAEQAYNAMRESGIPPHLARAVLPNALKTEVVMTANFREWRHVIRMRCAQAAHPQIRPLIAQIGKRLMLESPTVFGDLEELINQALPGEAN